MRRKKRSEAREKCAVMVEVEGSTGVSEEEGLAAISAIERQLSQELRSESSARVPRRKSRGPP